MSKPRSTAAREKLEKALEFYAFDCWSEDPKPNELPHYALIADRGSYARQVLKEVKNMRFCSKCKKELADDGSNSYDAQARGFENLDFICEECSRKLMVEGLPKLSKKKKKKRK